MTMTIRAVYEGCILRPIEPLAVPEGESVDVTVTQTKLPGSPLRAPTPAEEDYVRQLNAAKSLQEMFAVMATAPLSPGEEFDIVKEINESRRLTGFRMPEPDSAEENSR